MTWFEERPKKFNKIFDSKINGDSFSQWYNSCANVNPTITFIKTKENYRFGAFTSIYWPKENNIYSNDEKSFLFSLDKKKNIRLRIHIKHYIIRKDNILIMGQDRIYTYMMDSQIIQKVEFLKDHMNFHQIMN